MQEDTAQEAFASREGGQIEALKGESEVKVGRDHCKILGGITFEGEWRKRTSQERGTQKERQGLRKYHCESG